jgi:3-deoxy-manno-octulosonate cytidylyltransferase (CMP-KDO synthetase)
LKVLGIIPARYKSTRFEGKPLADIAGKTMIQRVYEQCLQAASLSEVIVATDDGRIMETVKNFGGNVLMTSSTHMNGTSRCTEISASLPQFDYIINIQGDEPLIHPEQIDELAELFQNVNAQIVTQAKISTDLNEWNNPNIVKVILDDQQFALDFVREPDDLFPGQFFKHVGIYGFKTYALQEIMKLEPTQNEMDRRLEQMRWLDNGLMINTGITTYDSISIDTTEDLEKVIQLFSV